MLYVNQTGRCAIRFVTASIMAMTTFGSKRRLFVSTDFSRRSGERRLLNQPPAAKMRGGVNKSHSTEQFPMRTAEQIHSDLKNWREQDAKWSQSLDMREAHAISIGLGNDPQRSDKLKIILEAKDWLALADPNDMVLPWAVQQFQKSLTPSVVTECLDRLEAAISRHAEKSE